MPIDTVDRLDDPEQAFTDLLGTGGIILTTVTSAAVAANGNSIAVVFSAPVQNRIRSIDFALSSAMAWASHTLSADGLTLTLLCRRPIFSSEALTLAYTGITVVDTSGNLVAPFAGQAVTNSSTKLALGPPAFLNVTYPILTWPVVATATGYRLYVNGVLQYDTASAAGPNTLTSYTDPVATDGRPIDQPTYSVSAYSGAGEGPQTGTLAGLASLLLGQTQQAVTLVDGAAVNGKIVRFGGPQPVAIDDARYEIPIGVAVNVPASIKTILQQAGMA
jgi:hypothetical protein